MLAAVSAKGRVLSVFPLKTAVNATFAGEPWRETPPAAIPGKGEIQAETRSVVGHSAMRFRRQASRKNLRHLLHFFFIQPDCPAELRR